MSSALQLALEGPRPEPVADPGELRAAWDLIAAPMRHHLYQIPDDDAELAQAYETIKGLVSRGDVLAEALERGRASALEGLTWYETSLLATTAELIRLLEGVKAMREVLEGWFDVHTATLKEHPELEAQLADAELLRAMRKGHDVLHQVPILPPPRIAPPLDADVCRSCGAAIVWGVTENGKPCPLDAKPQLRYLPNTTNNVVRLREVYITHFITCPFANQHKKPKGPTK